MSHKSYKNPLPLVEGEGKRKSGPIAGLDMHKKVIAYCITTERKILLEGEFQQMMDLGINPAEMILADGGPKAHRSSELVR